MKGDTQLSPQSLPSRGEKKTPAIRGYVKKRGQDKAVILHLGCALSSPGGFFKILMLKPVKSESLRVELKHRSILNLPGNLNMQPRKKIIGWSNHDTLRGHLSSRGDVICF